VAKKEDADARRCPGRGRGGLSTKVHAAVDRRGRLLRLALTPGHKGDCPQAEGLLEGLARGTVGHVIADAAYDSDALREHVRGPGAGCRIRPNPTRKNKKRCDRERYKHRNVIERYFGVDPT
jgi:putative transposase